jgi:hypothetical protein
MVIGPMGAKTRMDLITDHINGDHSSSILSNIAPVFKFDNTMKAVIKLVTRIDSSGNAVVFGGPTLAAESVPGSFIGHITKCLSRKQINHNGYQWKDASKKDIDLFFSKMNNVDNSRLGKWKAINWRMSKY